MQGDEIRRAVQATIEAVAPEADLQRIRSDQPLREQLDLDSMDWINVVAGIGERLAIDIQESDYAQLATFDAIVAYLAGRQRDGDVALGIVQAKAPIAHTTHRVAGSLVTVRPIRRDDAALESEFVGNLSDETRYQRFMAGIRQLSQEKLAALTDVDQVRDVALAATVQRDGREAMVGAARYGVGPDGDACEFAIAVDDAWRGTGLAGILMQTLIGIARRRGLARMEGIVLTTNRRMLRLARRLGFRVVDDPAGRDTVRIVRPLRS